MELDHLTLGEMPEEFIENEDGSVDIPDLEPVMPAQEFLANLAEVFSESELNSTAVELCELIEKDKEARKKRDEQYEEGLRRTGLGNDAPGGASFEGSSRVVHPVLAEGCVDFASRAIKELFPAAGPVKSYIAGEVTPQKLEKAGRKVRFMNWQLTTDITEYRSELEQLLTQLPMGGSQYLKFMYDNRLDRPAAEFVPIDEMILPYAATNFYTSPRATHRQLITKHQLHSRIKSGLYRDIFLTEAQDYPDQTATAQANDKIEGREEDGYNEDGLRAVLEVHAWLEFESDELTGGESAPYIITIDEDTEKVLALYRNWKEGDVRQEKLDWVVEWKFIPWRGAYAIGLPHLIGGLAAALTGALRALLDSAHINNAASMLKLKSGRVVGQNTQVAITQVTDIDAPAGVDDIRKIAMPMPFNPPSPVLAQIMDSMYGLAKGMVATTEESVGQVGDRTPVGTTMALIESGSTTYSAIHARLHESQKKAFEILQRINRDTLDEARVIEKLGEQLVTREDFEGTLDTIPVSDPTIFSESQRFAQVQAILQMAQDQTVPWNKQAIYKRALKQMRIEAPDELLAPQKDPVTANFFDENSKAIEGFPLKAVSQQEHIAHIKGHLAYVSSPLQAMNPLVPPQVLLAIIGHIGEHIQMLQQETAKQLAMQMAVQMQGASIEEVLVQAVTVAGQQLSNLLQPAMQQLMQVQQEVQKRVPPPQMPPEVQASIQIAQMDTQRKQAYDQASIGIEREKIQAQGQQNQIEAQLAQQKQAMQQQFESMQLQYNAKMEEMKLEMERQVHNAKMQLELVINEKTNAQKHETETEKNHEDNFTKLVIEREKMHNQTLTNIADSIFGEGPKVNGE